MTSLNFAYSKRQKSPPVTSTLRYIEALSHSKNYVRVFSRWGDFLKDIKTFLCENIKILPFLRFFRQTSVGVFRTFYLHI